MNSGNIDDTALSEFTLLPPNASPVVRDEVVFGLSADDYGILTIAAVDLLANDSDADGHQLSVVAVDGAELLDGTVRLSAAHDQHDGSVRSFTYTVADELGALSSATAWVIVEDQSSDHHHGGSGQMHAEHMAALDLAPHADATHFAVRTGAWSDPTTWLNGEIPDDDDRAVILEGVDVLYDVASDASLFTVRVDGELRFDHTQSTRLEVDTLLVGEQGSLIIGDKDNPIEDGVTADIVFANNGGIDVEWDPMLLSRGLVSLGKVEIHGEEVQAHAKVSADPLAGASSIEFADAPTGWKVGDTIVIAGTNYDGYKWDNAIRAKRHYEPEDEVRTITAIDGDTVHFDEPLEYDHSAPREDLKTSVANYSRSVTFQTEGGETAATFERGHVMFMHSNDVDARYAAFDHLGRTDKSISSASASSFEDVDATTNVQGRYSLHLHRTGSDGDAVDLVGNAVFGSPGWGIVHHDSHAVIDGNATYDTYGAGFVAETGNETGVWSNNIAIYAQGRSWAAAKNINSGSGLDIGKSGDGFWFRGRAVDAIDNIAASVNNGFIYYHRGGGTLPVEADSYQLSELLLPLSNSDGRLPVDKPAILGFDGNEVFASNNGFHVVKANPKQSHDVNSVISNFGAWSVRTGIDVEYSSEYTFKDVDLVGREPGLFVKAEAGVDFGRNVYGINLNNVKIDGFKYGAKLGAGFTSSQFVREELPYHLVDVEISNANRDFLGLREDIDVVISGDDLNTDPIEINIDQNLVYERVNGGNYYLKIKGSKVDSLGETQIVDDFDKFVLKAFHVTKILREDGYYTNDDGQNVFFFKSYHSDRGTGEIFKAYTPIIIGEDVPLGRGAYADAVYRGHVSSENQNPLGHNDNFVLDGENEIVIDVLANDSDPEGEALSLDGFLQPHHGSVSLNEDGELIYRPSALGPQNDKFKYWLTDGEGGLAEAWAHFTMAPPNASLEQWNLSDEQAGEEFAYRRDFELNALSEATSPTSADEGTSLQEADLQVFSQTYFTEGANSLHLPNSSDGSLSAAPSSGDDHLSGTRGSDLIRGLAGDDTINGRSAADSLAGGRGDDFVKGASGDDSLKGNSGQDVLKGNSGSDTIEGGAGDDRLIGGGGKDTLSGGRGDDTIFGRNGKDVLSGGEGSDVFQFRAENAIDSVLDFVHGEDKLAIKGPNQSFDTLQILQSEDDVIVDFGEGRFRLISSDAEIFEEADFLF